jgi:hypothetical protein
MYEGGQAQSEVGEAYSELRDLASRILDEIRREAQSNPLRTVAIAAGAGFALGGGVLSSLTARVLGLGLRVVLSAAALPSVMPLAAGGIWTLITRQQHDAQGEESQA